MHYYIFIIKYLTTEPPWRKGQKSTLKETNNDALIIFKVHVYLVVIPEKKTDRQIPGKYNIETIAVPLWND